MSGTALLRIALIQENLKVGDIAGNEARIADAMDWAEAQGADICVFPELAVTGYPPEDLLLAHGFVEANEAAVERLAKRSRRCTSIIGFVADVEDTRRGDAVLRGVSNAVAVVADGRIQDRRAKALLPNYGVFDEERYFVPGKRHMPAYRLGSDDGAGLFGIAVCEDVWAPEIADAQRAAGAQILIVPNASPYHQTKPAERYELLAATARRTGMPVVYLNLVGGQDEVVFDGGSIVVGAAGEILARLPLFRETRAVVDVALAPAPAPRIADRHGTVYEIPRVAPVGIELPATGQCEAVGPVTPPMAAPISDLAETYLALVTGTRDYIVTNGFRQVVLGLSGGIDSALVATIAADAVGAEAVWGVGMPGPYSSEGSVTDARELAERLGCRFDIVQIRDTYEAMLDTLHGPDNVGGVLAGTGFDATEENLQARLRGMVLMALTNKSGGIVLTTSNKSESAVGYTTLYGDMSGGFAPIRDVPKLLVFELSRWRNTLNSADLAALELAPVVSPIPEATLTKPPSAELAPGQRDDLSLPPYSTLDPILALYVEQAASVDDIIAAGYDSSTVQRITALVDRAEYKRRQAAPGVKVTRRAFGRDRRLPITNGWRDEPRSDAPAGAEFVQPQPRPGAS